MRNRYFLPLSVVLLVGMCGLSCRKHLENVNLNPNGADPGTTNPNLVLSTVLSSTGKAFADLGFGDILGVMQYCQKDGWGTTFNNYDWDGDNPWSPYYDILRNDAYVLDKARASGNGLVEGIALTMRAMVFGLLTDLYGDVPYTDALKGAEGGKSNTFPAYTTQQTVYAGILSDLDSAQALLSRPASDYTESPGTADLYYQGDPAAWRRLANSLSLRYYMRISEKSPEVARAGIEKIVGDPDTYPLITSASQDATLAFPGDDQDDSWPTNAAYDADSSNYRRVKMCDTFVRALEALSDPRLAVWAEQVQIFLLVDEDLPPGTDVTRDTVVDGEPRKVRYLSPDILSARGLTTADINQDPHYVGLPVALTGPQAYNLSPDLNQGSHNPHVSWLNIRYAGAGGGLLRARLMSAAEVHFIIAEASAVKGWTAADPATEYAAAIKASFDAWGVSAAYQAYMTQPAVQFDGTQKQIITQKWIAAWSDATESWFDYRRTGYPLLAGVQGRTIAPVLPVRLYYPKTEQNLNGDHEQAASGTLEITPYSGFGADGSQDSPWSKMWVLQGTNKPW